MEEVKNAAGAVSQQAENAVQTLEEQLTVLWHNLPSWQQDNHYIQSGYRPASGSYRKSARSLGYLHNESVNIYSHLIGASLSVIAAFTLYFVIRPRYEVATKQDNYVFGCFFIGAIGCLGMSSTYHAISNHSQEVATFYHKLDYLGIVLLIWGSFVPSIYYGFACDKQLIRTYWTMITTIGAGCAVVSTSPKFRQPQWRPLRAVMFVAMGLSAIVPVLHGLQLYGMQRLDNLIALRWLVLQGALYVLGASIYAARVPERFSPGRFDIWGSSHQICHVLVLLAAMVHFTGLLKAFDYHHSYPYSYRCNASFRDHVGNAG